MADSTQTQGAYANAQAKTDEQKKALLAALAQSGTAGAQAYQDAQQNVDQARSNAVGSLVPADLTAGNARSSFAQDQQNIISAPHQQAQADLSQGLAAYKQYMDLQQSANSNYMDQVSAATPIEQTVTERAVQQILADKEIQKATIAANLAAAQSRGSGGSGGGSASSQLSAQKYADQQKQDLFNNILQSYAIDDNGDVMNARANAINKIINIGIPIEQAWSGMPDADKNAIREAVNAYYSQLQSDTPFTQYDTDWHAANDNKQGSGLGNWLAKQGIPVNGGSGSASGSVSGKNRYA